MTYGERDEIFKSSEYIGKVKIALCDWLNYWAVNGTEDIEDSNLKERTDLFIKFCLDNIDAYAKKIAILSISEPSIKNAIEITDANIENAVTHLMSSALGYLL